MVEEHFLASMFIIIEASCQAAAIKAAPNDLEQTISPITFAFLGLSLNSYPIFSRKDTTNPNDRTSTKKDLNSVLTLLYYHKN